MRVRVTPGAACVYVGGAWDDPDGGARLLVRVPAPPEKGRANEAAAMALAAAFGLPKSAVSLTAGAADRRKTFSLKGDPDVLAARAASLLKENRRGR